MSAEFEPIDNTAPGQFTGGGEVKLVRRLPGPIERVWEYLTDPEKRGLWLARGITDPRPGGEVRLEFYHSKLTSHEEVVPEKYREECQDGAIVTGRIIRCEPPRLLSHTWGEPDGSETEVTFELSPEGDGVRLLVTHRKMGDRETMISVSSGWHAHVSLLIAKLEGREPPPFWEAHAKLEEEYAERLAAVMG